MKTIKVKFVDIWKTFFNDTSFLDILKKHYNVEISDEPDFLFYCNHWTLDFQKYDNCVKICYAPECSSINFNECDYGIGYDHMTFEDRYLRYNHGWKDLKLIDEYRKKYKVDFDKRQFCNFIYSNNWSKGTDTRKNFCIELMKYKHVDCFGKVLHNATIPDFPTTSDNNWYEAKFNILKNYRYTITFENFSANGYTTEKIIQPLMVNSVPIYWGNPKINHMVNPKAFINCHDFANFDEVIEYIKYLEEHEDKYLEILNAPVLVTQEQNIDYESELEKFLINIIEKGNKPFNKDVLGVSSAIVMKATLICQQRMSYSPFEYIFSVKNSPDKKHKVITILGIHMKFKKATK